MNREIHWVKGIDPIANGFAGTVATDIFELWGEEAIFIIYKGVGATGTSTITVLACDDIVPTNTTAVPFRYRTCTTGDTWGAWTAVANTGFTTTAGSSQLYEIRVDANAVGATGYGYVKLVAVEVVANAVLGGVLCGVSGLRYSVQPESLID
jgi:hypothetical protein